MKRLVIANRGEIALRVARAARELGFTVGLLQAPGDEDGVALANVPEVNRIAVASYLNVGDVVRACQAWNADLVHPGYGFLAENAGFAVALDAAGIGFVGPTAEQMHLLGEKESSKRLAERYGVPTLQAVYSDELVGCGSGAELEALLRQRGIHSPWLVKASGGGGGRGMRVVKNPQELLSAVRLASSEAAAGFGNASVFVERYLEKGRHIEVQVFGDGIGGGVALGERECSLQRRHQKVVEEAPSPVVGAELREKLGASALRLVHATQYRGAGTVEFLLTPDQEFFFLEMNTRLQVEHPITEEVFGVDLVRAQLQLACGLWPSESVFADPQSLSVRHPKGHAIEVRILAEDPSRGFVPTPGRVVDYRPPKGEGLRLESALIHGCRVNPEYDSMIAKLIARGENRRSALKQLQQGLSELRVSGFPTNVDFLRALVSLPSFVAGDFHTQWLEQNLTRVQDMCLAIALGDLLPDRVVDQHSQAGVHGVARECRRFLLQEGASQGSASGSLACVFRAEPQARSQGERSWSKRLSPNPAATGKQVWVEPCPAAAHSSILSGVAFRLVGPGVEAWAQRVQATSLGQRSDLQEILHQATGGWGLELTVSLTPRGLVLFHIQGVDIAVDLPVIEARSHGAGTAVPELIAPMPGKIVEQCVQVGDTVEEGSVVIVMESMKMQLEIRAGCAGVVSECGVRVGQMVDAGAVLARIGRAEEQR